MDYHFKIKIKNFDDLLVKFNDTDLSRNYMALFYRNYQKQRPILRDLGSYDIDRMQYLAQQAKELLNWDWLQDDYTSLEATTKMHKDIEQYAGAGFDQVNAEHDSLLHELHYCLHSMQVHNQRGSMQIEWFNDDGFSLDPYAIEFSHDSTLGAIQLQNPFVGHSPDWMWEQNDYTNVWQTCKFHNWVRPGMVIILSGTIQRSQKSFDVDAYLAWWQHHAPDFVEHHSIEKLKSYAGKPVIGYVVNNQELLKLQGAPKLELDCVKFNPDILPLLNTSTIPHYSSIRRHDYNNVAGPDWPSYDDFVADKNVPLFVKQEVKTMLL